MIANHIDDAPRLTMSDIIPTQHAIDRALDMAVDPRDIRDAIEDPEYAYISAKHQTWALRKGRITVCVTEHSTQADKWALLTVLWATDEDWARDAATGAGSAGRDYRPRGLDGFR